MTDDLRTERQFTAARENIKGIVAKAVEGFLQTKEYNTVLFNWYFKGFELLRRYFIKHPSGVDLEKLDIEEVDKEMVDDEASQSSTTETIPASTNALENASVTNDVAADA